MPFWVGIIFWVVFVKILMDEEIGAPSSLAIENCNKSLHMLVCNKSES